MSKATHAAAGALVLALTLSASMTANAADAMRIVRDPVTGEMRGPTPAEVTAFERAEAQLRLSATGKAAKQQQGPVEIRHADGSVELKLGEDTMMYSVVSTAADGSLAFDCLPAKEAQKYVKGKKSSISKTAAKVGHDHQ